MTIPPIPSRHAPSQLGTPPRHVTTTIKAHVFLALLITLTVGVPIFFFWYGQKEHARLDRLSREGQQTEGLVTSKSRRKSTYTLRYAYVVNGVEYKDSEKVSSTHYNAHDVGSPVMITYLPADPAVNEYGYVQARAGEKAETTQQLIGAVAGLALLVGTGALEWSIRKDRRLCELGLEALGHVTDQTRGKHPKTHYAFTTQDGEHISTKSAATSATKKLDVGEELVVLYDPEKPSRNKPYIGISLAHIPDR